MLLDTLEEKKKMNGHKMFKSGDLTIVMIGSEEVGFDSSGVITYVVPSQTYYVLGRRIEVHYLDGKILCINFPTMVQVRADNCIYETAESQKVVEKCQEIINNPKFSNPQSIMSPALVSLYKLYSKK